MDENVKTALTTLRIETDAAVQGSVDLWHKGTRLLNLMNDVALTHRGTALMREQVLSANMKISDALNELSGVKDLLELVVPDPALAAVDGDADGVG